MRFLAKLFGSRHPSRPVESEGTPLESAASAISLPDGSPSEPEPVTPSNPPVAKGADVPSPLPAALGKPKPPGPTPITSPVDKVLRRLTQERMEVALEDAREELEKVKRDSALRIRQLEAEREQSRLEASQERTEQQEVESRIRPLQKALDSMERRLEEERRAAQARIQELEALVNASRAPELSLQVRALEAQLDVVQRELAAAQEESGEQVRRLQAERQDWERQLATKEQELGALLKETNQIQERVNQQEAVLQRAQERLGQLGAELAERDAQVKQLRAAPPITAAAEASETASAAAAPASEKSGLLPPDVAANFYQQTMSTLTVLLAASDLLAMNQRLDPSLRETAREIRTQGQKVVGLIKSITYPEKAKEG
ncbi:MAG: hypothetical protein HY648_05950 [Acidobacteria bacterium]|nr:hypothetical protein [Acidobacteriota bacterium]